MSLSDKLIGGPILKRSPHGPADRLSGVGLALAFSGLALLLLFMTVSIVVDLTGHPALSTQVIKLAFYPLALCPIGMLIGLIIPHFAFTIVDPTALPDEMVTEFADSPTERLR